MNDKTICSKKDRIDIKSERAMKTSVESLSQPEARNLRPRAVSFDYFGIYQQRKGTNPNPTLTGNQIEDLLRKIDSIQNQIDNLEIRKYDWFYSKRNN